MPAHRTRLASEPLPPLLNIQQVVESTPNFDFAMRITCDAVDEFPLEDFEKLVLFQVVLTGRPLVIEGFHQRFDKGLFSEKWLRENYASKSELVLWECLFLHRSVLTIFLNSRGSSRSCQEGEQTVHNGALS